VKARQQRGWAVKDNKWKHGSRGIEVPPLPKRLRQSSGCLLAEAIFDSVTGPEIYLAILEDSMWCRSLAATRPFKIFCKSGLAQTGNGSIIFLIWRIAAESTAETVHEHFLNPNNIETIRDLVMLAQQTHLKSVLISSQTSEVIDWFEFENGFGFEKLLNGAVEATRHEPPGNFSEAMDELTKRYSLEDLMNA
jgi:hypothetical protein